ncbi:MAG: hypothetical protein H6Q90_6966, partial [Deltaproteobacteria bacterium]|nr:hypothetical protein [Deltaproteobacteria bacterium]
RPTTDTDTWSWDYHLDYLTGQYSSDYDNNGVAQPEDGGAQLITGGLSGRYHDWAAAVTVTGQTAPIGDTADMFTADALRLRYMVSKYFPERDIAVGLGAQQVIFALGAPGEPALFQINGGGLVGGITYVPRLRNYRVAGGLESQILGGNVVTNSCDPLDCNGYILPESVVSPVRGIVGFAYRFADTAWNQQVGGIFRDEKSLTLTADVLVTGNSPNAYGIEAFGMQMLQRSGESVAIRARGGVEIEPLPGRLRVRAGTYWEPARFEGVGGRIHGTFGLELRMLEFQAWGRRRGRISFTGDVASRYKNLAFSVGFWH